MLSETLIAQAKTCDLLSLAGRYTRLVRVASTGGSEYAGPCPLCPGGRDRFRVQPECHRWMCRQCTQGRWQDAITLQRRLTGQSFVEAVCVLTGALPSLLSAMPVEPSPCLPGGAPSAAWQARAHSVIERAADDLWSSTGGRALDWLHARGLLDATLKRWNIGYIQTERHEAAWRWGLQAGKAIYLPVGVLVPCQVDTVVSYLKIRKLEGRPKYTQIRGSHAALYLADTIQSRVACLTEGEFDALLLWQLLQQTAEPRWQTVGVVTAGSQSTRPDAEGWGAYLSGLDRLLIFYDQDGKSDLGAKRWSLAVPHARIVHWPNLRPGDKDLTDFHLAGGDLVALVASSVVELPAGGNPAAPARLKNA